MRLINPAVLCPISSGRMIYSNLFLLQCLMDHTDILGLSKLADASTSSWPALHFHTQMPMDHSDFLCTSMQADVAYIRIAGSGLSMALSPTEQYPVFLQRSAITGWPVPYFHPQQPPDHSDIWGSSTDMSSSSCIAAMAWCLVVKCRGSLLQQRLCHLFQPCSEVDQDSTVWASQYRGTLRPMQENECQEQSVNSEPN